MSIFVKAMHDQSTKEIDFLKANSDKEEYMAVDEQMIPTKAKTSGMRQYNSKNLIST